jgi:hypothetical protein
MDYDSLSWGDIFFPKGFRFKSEKSLKIQKPYTYSEMNLNSEITIPYGTDLTDLERRLTTLENNEEGLTIEKINDINPYFGIDKILTSSNDYVIPIHNNNLFEYYKLMDSTQTKTFGVFISPYISTGNNQNLFHVVKRESYNTVNIGYSDGYSNITTTITGKLYLTNSISSTKFSCLSDGIHFTKNNNANDKVIISYGTDFTNIGS